MDYDVAVVGAGAAGIAAARVLHAAGRKVVLVEASSRAGGRAWTVELAGMPLDMGCGWLHSAERNPMVELARSLKWEVVEGPAAWHEQWHDLGFSKIEQHAAWQAWEDLIDRLRIQRPASDRASDALVPEGRWNDYCQSLSGYLNGTELEQLSVADFLAYEDASSEANWRVKQGYGSLVASCVPKVALHLSCPVKKVSMTSSGVHLETCRGNIEARAAVITVSTNILASGKVSFDPMVDQHLHAASQLPLGVADKLFFELYGDHGLETETHVLGNPNNPETGTYYIRPFGRPLVEGFFGGSGALLIEEGGLLDAFAFALDEVAALFGNDVRKHLKPLAASSWRKTDWVQGSYSHALPGQAVARDILMQPLDGRLFFAGEAVHRTDFSTVHGAWESGERAARAFLNGTDNNVT